MSGCCLNEPKQLLYYFSQGELINECDLYVFRATPKANMEAPLTVPTLCSWTLTSNTSSPLKEVYRLPLSLTPEALSLHLHRGIYSKKGLINLLVVSV